MRKKVHHRKAHLKKFQVTPQVLAAWEGIHRKHKAHHKTLAQMEKADVKSWSREIASDVRSWKAENRADQRKWHAELRADRRDRNKLAKAGM